MSRSNCGCRRGHERNGRETIELCATHEAEWRERHEAARRSGSHVDRECDLERRRAQAHGNALLMPQAD